MQARPDRFEPRWVQSKAAPDVRFYIEPLLFPMRMYCTSNNLVLISEDEDGKLLWGKELLGESLDMLRLGLKDIEGLVDASGEPVKLEFTKKKLGGIVAEIITEASLERIPDDLLWEIGNAVTVANSLKPEEAKDLKNTQNSPTENSTVPETSPPAPVETESCS